METIHLYILAQSKNGRYQLNDFQLEAPAHSLNEASRQIPGGVYTTFRTYYGDKILPLEDHIQRLESSARLSGHSIHINQPALEDALRHARQNASYNEVVFRITVDLERVPGTIYLGLGPLKTPPPESYQSGVHAVTFRHRRSMPRAKRTAFISVAQALSKELPPDANECLLVDDQGYVMEGLSSNFFGVKDGIVYTAEEGVLPGVTRSIILDAARQEGITVQFERIHISQIGELQEAFVSSSSRSILPVRQIDDVLIGAGVPGPVTERLSLAFWREIHERLETL